MDHTSASRGNLVFGIIFVLALGAIILWRSFGRPDVPASELVAFDQNLTLAQAQQRAAESGRPIFVYATASWCPPCRQFKAQTLSREEVSDLLVAEFEPVYLDIDKASADARSLRVSVVPTLMIFKDGVEVDRRTGAMPTGEFLEFLRPHGVPAAEAIPDPA